MMYRVQMTKASISNFGENDLFHIFVASKLDFVLKKTLHVNLQICPKVTEPCNLHDL